ncbi:MAG: helix-turn-helix domain-containing protein, partial [Actinobacteria bacterium]|nr:helix-turn-helix domain-containing protein [Actinomycetota bacterium]
AQGAAELLARWGSHSRRAHTESRTESCAWIPVRLHDEEWGRLHALAEGAAPVDEVDALALDRAAAAIGLWLLSSRDRAALADRARGEFITDLWQGKRWSGTDALARSRSLGGGLEQPVLAGIAVEFSGEGRGDTGARDAGAGRALDTVRARLERLVAEAGLSCMAAVVGSVCVAIVGFAADASVRSVTDRLAAELQAELHDELRGRRMSVGISRPGSVETLRRVLTEAIDSAGHGAHSLSSSGVFHSADLGLRHLLARLGDGTELSRFVEDELGPLLAHEAECRTPLLPTLRVYLDSGGQKAAAARTLHLERRSLYYRLERIEALLDADLDDPSARLRAQVALQGLDVLRQRHAGHPAG